MMKRRFPAAQLMKNIIHTCAYRHTHAEPYQLVEQSVGCSVSWHVLSRLDTVRGAPLLV